MPFKKSIAGCLSVVALPIRSKIFLMLFLLVQFSQLILEEEVQKESSQGKKILEHLWARGGGGEEIVTELPPHKFVAKFCRDRWEPRTPTVEKLSYLPTCLPACPPHSWLGRQVGRDLLMRVCYNRFFFLIILFYFIFTGPNFKFTVEISPKSDIKKFQIPKWSDFGGFHFARCQNLK
jgi:hypothetical protein